MARPIVPQSVAPRDVPIDPDGPVPLGMKRTRSGRLKRRNIFWRMRRYLVAGVAIMVLAASGAGAQLWASVPVPKQKDPDRASLLCDATVPNGCERSNAFAEVGVAETEGDVRYSEIPQVMVFALVAAEDKEFFSHKGVDPTGIARALVHDVRNDSRQGGSTLTQQLVKVMSNDDSPTVSRKIKEAVQAMKMEQDTPKAEILERYFNSVYFGRNARGLVAAVRAYFGPDFKVKDITLKHAAYLSALIREPEDVDANRKPDDPERDEQRRYATIRRGNVLDTMLAQGYIKQAEHDEAAKAEWDYVVPRTDSDKGAVLKYNEFGAGQWRDYVLEWIEHNIKEIPKAALKTKGYRIYTSMNPDLQRQAQEAVRDTLKNTPLPWIGNPADKPPDLVDGPEASLTSIDSQGFVRAMVGSRNIYSSLNVATGRLGGLGAGRQPGSSFKPIVLASALLTGGKNLDDKYDNPQSKEIGPPGAVQKVVSVEGDATKEPITLEQAMAISSNTVFGQLQFDIKNADVIALAKKMGLTDPDNFQDDAKTSAFLGIGGPVHVTTLDMASVYSVFANHGDKIGPYPVMKITDAAGNPIWPTTPFKSENVLRADIAEQINYTLKGVVSPEGTGKNVNVPGQIVVGKTGTVAKEDANKKVIGNTDAWFVGYTCKLTAAVWMGHRNDAGDLGEIEHEKKVNGGTLPVKIFNQFMTGATKLDQYKTSCPFERPPGSITTTTAPATTAPPSTKDRPWWDRDRDKDPDDDNTSTTRKLPPWWPTTTDPDDRTTTTRRTGPTLPTTTIDTPGRPRAATP
jgi:membrane peptidoglycan carboxypeptidase